MRTRKIYNYLFKTGIAMFPLSILMFIVGASMFAAHGDFPRFVIKLTEICFRFWIPTFILGIILLIISSILKKLKF